MKKILTILAINTLVRDEAKKLKKNSTVMERSNLEFNNLNTDMRDRCIYGQMTGDCFSDRASELITKSCKRVFTDKCHDNGFIDNRMGSLKGELNGKPKAEDRVGYWSPIEIFIDMPRNKNNGNNERLIKFLKGESETLVLK